MLRPLSAKAYVKNNLVYSAEADFNNTLVVPAGTMESNVYCTASYVSNTRQAFADYQKTSESTAKSVASITFADITNGDLDLTGTSDGNVNLGVDALTDVTTDIYGVIRGTYTYAGAYEGTKLTDPDDTATGTEDINTNTVEVKKVVRNNQILIIRNDKTYNIIGKNIE